MIVRVGPRDLFADIRLVVLVGVHAGALGDAAERDDVELGRARGDDQAVEIVGLDVVLHLLLPGVRAGEDGVLGNDDAGFILDGVDDRLDIDVVGDVAAAMADIDADPAAGGVLLDAHATASSAGRPALTLSR